MSAPKLRAFLSAVNPDGTVTVHIKRPKRAAPFEALRATTRKMDEAFGLCLYKSGVVATSTDELDDMVEMSVRAVQWLQELRLALVATVQTQRKRT